MAFDWDQIQSEAGGNYKAYAPDGVYEVKAEDATIRTTSTGTTWVEISFEENEQYQFPKISHPLSDKNANWRCWHFMNMLKELGVSEEKAKAAIEACESKSNKDARNSAYEQAFKRAAAKHNVVKLSVSSEEGSNQKIYARGDFANSSLAMGNRNNTTNSSPLAGATEIKDDGFIDELGF